MIDKDLIGKVRYPKRDVRILLRHYMEIHIQEIHLGRVNVTLQLCFCFIIFDTTFCWRSVNRKK